MSQGAFSLDEFIDSENTLSVEVEDAENAAETEPSDAGEIVDGSEDIDVQKAVVESLAADKAALDCELDGLKKILSEKERQLAVKTSEFEELKKEVWQKDFEIATLKIELAKSKAEFARNFEAQLDRLERNPNAVALLDREVELPDRFQGETRDHVLEVVKEARDRAELEGRRRRAQILESVLVANEPNGTLAERRAELEKILAENNNVINGSVIEKLTEFELSHREGDEYLLAREILLRNF